MANPWGKKVGAWAEDVERAEEEAKLQREAAPNDAPDDSFPSLEQAAAAPKPKKKSKGQKLSLSELQSGQHIGRGAGASSKVFSDNKGLTVDERLSLPKGPREKTGDDFQDTNRWGSSRSRGGPPPPFNETRRGGGGGGGFGFSYNEDERRPSFNQGRSAAADRDLMPSRADEVDNWGAGKPSMPPPGLAAPGPRRFEGDRFDASSSRADDVDNWASAKKFTPAPDRRPMGFGSSYRDPKSDSYRRDDFVPAAPAPTGERKRLVLNPRTVPLDAATPAPAPAAASSGNRPSPFGNARPREEVLAEKAKLENGDESKHGSRPTSADSSRADSVSSHGEFAPQPPKPRPKINPFGEAIPRENILTKRGVDHKKMDLDVFKAFDRDETEEEINMKKEISDLRERLAKFFLNASSENGKVIAEDDEENEEALKEKLSRTESELETRVKELNEKARQEKRTSDRQGPSGGRSYEYFERPGSQSGRMESSKSFESLERPRSRGNENRVVFDGWVRPVEERRQGRSGFTGRQRSDTGGRW